jgi:hypothetical protein
VDKEKLKTLPGQKTVFAQFVANDNASSNIGSSTSSSGRMDNEDFVFSTATEDDYHRLMNDESTGATITNRVAVDLVLDGTEDGEQHTFAGDLNIDDI